MGIMAIPAEIAFRMSLHIDSRYPLMAVGGQTMTLAAKSVRGRLFSRHEPRIGKMLVGDIVTPFAGQFYMMRNQFLRGDLTVAGAALFRGVREHRIVRLMTTHTWLSGVVLYRKNLRKTGGPGRIVTVTEDAVAPSPRRPGCVLIGRFYMQSRRAVADFT
jgi:hypothetical protein